MKGTPVNLANLNKNDLYTIASALLYVLKENKQYTTVSELFYILDYDNFMKLIQYYGGQVVKIPSAKDIMDTLGLLLLYQYYEIDGMTWEAAIAKAGYDNSRRTSIALRTKLQYLRRMLKDKKIGGRDYK